MIEKIKDEIAENDNQIYFYFLKLANNQNKREELKSKYSKLFTMDEEYDAKIDLFVKMINASEFIHHVNTYDVINKNMSLLKSEEEIFRNQIEKILENNLYRPAITIEMRAAFNKYLSEDWVYFSNNQYMEESLKLLSESMTNYQVVISKAFFLTKKELLDYQVQLLNHE